MASPGRLRSLLVPLSWGYGALIGARNFFYDKGMLTIERIGTPVVSVGNITTGGTGKTPLVEHLARRLMAAGRTPAILSRGYGRNTRGTLVVSDGQEVQATPDRGGDEPVLLARKLRGCAVVVDERRARGARVLEETFHPDVIVLDDGFQHRALHRDLDIVIIDDGESGPAGRMLPAGNLREPLGALRRAGLVIVNRRETGKTPMRASGRVVMSHRLKRFVEPATGAEVPGDAIRETSCIAFCGIGNPASFHRTLLGTGIRPEDLLVFPDHHRFTDADLSRLDEASDVNGARYIVTTEKDAVRLELDSGSSPRIPSGIVVAEIETVIEEGDELLGTALAGLGRQAA